MQGNRVKKFSGLPNCHSRESGNQELWRDVRLRAWEAVLALDRRHLPNFGPVNPRDNGNWQWPFAHVSV